MLRAFLAAAIIALIAPLIGTTIVLKRLSAIGDATSHSALAGIAFGLVAGVNPIIGAVAFSLFAVLGIEAFRKTFGEYGEIATVVVMSAGIGLAAVLSGFITSGSANLSSFMFGSIVSISDFETRQIGKLSGGQQQRVFIARALIAEPELLLLDEPTAGVDAANANAINDILTNLNKQGMTIIMTNHNTPELVKVATKLLIFCEHGNGEFVSKNNLTLEEVNDIFAGRRKHHHT